MKIKSGPRSLAGWGSLIFGVGCRLEASAKRPLIVLRALQLALTRAAPNRRSFGPWLGRGQIGAAARLAVALAGGSTAVALSLVGTTSDNGLPARLVQWTDAAGQTRAAIMVDQRPQGVPQGAGAGYLRQLTYKVNGVDRVCRGTGNVVDGDGLVQNHTASLGDFSSPGVPGTTTVVLAGAHHAIIAYDMPNYQISGQTVPTTIQWFFAEGRSHPIFALCQDARATAGNLGADSRSPYGDVAYDGLGADSIVGGASFGDTYKFVTLAAAPEQVTILSGWRYNEPNTIPYAMQWVDPAQADAEMGHVATLPISVKDQGSDSRIGQDIRDTQQLNGPLIDDDNWAYQIVNYAFNGNDPTDSKRLTWGSNWGLPGGFDNYGDTTLNVRQYSQHSTCPLGQALAGTRADGMLMAYSVFVVLGTHSGGYLNGTVGQMVKQMENAAQATLSAATGTVKTSGPAGVGNAATTTATYTPAGYNGVYATWEVVAAGNTVDATLTPAAGTSLDHPIFVVNGYTLGQLPASISVGNGLATPDVDYFATLDTAHQQLWITVNRPASSPVNLKVSAAAGGQQPVISNIPASGTVGTAIVITGNNFGGATAVTFNGASASFTVNSPTQITAVVPAGATVGPIAVTTPAGTATSATNFTPLAPPSGTLDGTFQQMDTDDGGWFTGLAAHPSGRLYGRTDVGGVYRSDDHGDSWTYLSGDLTGAACNFVQGLAIAAGNADVVYQCLGVSYNESGEGVWKSTDGGATWLQVKSGIHFSGNDAERWGGECIAVRPGNDSEVWAGSRGDGLWRSVNAGADWGQLGAATFAGAQFTSVCLPPVGRSDIWVGASGFSGPGGVWVSVNEGASWTQITGTQAGVDAPAGCWRIVRESNGKVLVAGGNGALGTVLYEFNAANWSNPATYTWTDLSWPGIDRSQDAPLVAALADGRIVAGSIFGGYNGGPDSLRTQVRSLAGLWSPADSLNGVMPAWQRTPAPVLIEGGRNALVQDPTDANRWFMAGGYGPFRTANGGASWQYIVNGIDEVVCYKVNFHPTDSSRVYLPMGDHGGAVVLDGGASGAVSRYITTRTLPYPDDLGLCHAILGSGDRLLALGVDERTDLPRIFKSTDNGVTWSVLAQAGLPNQAGRAIISAVASRDNTDDLIVALAGTDDGANGGVYRSVNGAAGFSRTTGLPTGADYGTVFDWNADLEVDATDNAVRYLFLKNYGLYKSTNRGASWTFVNTGLPSYGVMAADAILSGHLWVGTCCNQPVGLSRSVNSGSTWTTIAGFISVTDVDAAGDGVAVLGQRTGDTFNRIYYSADAGVTWGEITRPGYRFANAVAVAVDPYRAGTVWISSDGRSVARFTPGAVTAPPMLTLKAEAAYGLLKVVSGPNQYDRQNIATDTTSNDYGWIGGGATPVTYSLTIADFPGPAYSGLQAHVFLVPNSTGSTAPDYDNPAVVMLDIQGRADGTATAWFRHKVNEPGDNAFLYGAGTLGQLDCPTGAVGTWSMTFLNNTSVTVTAPNGAALQLTLPNAAAIQSAFGGRLTAYFGNQPNSVSQVGQSTTFSRIQISGAPRGQAIDETFPGPSLNQHPTTVSWQWLTPAASPAGISLPLSNNGLALSWTLPDTGYSLQFAASLSPAAWADLTLPNISTQGNSKTVHVTRSALPNSGRGFFRLIKH